MILIKRHLIAASLLLLGVGCAGYDDSAEQSEFERLRTYPISPQGDRILPDYGSEPASEENEALRFAFSPDGRIQRPFTDKSTNNLSPVASSLVALQHRLHSKRLISE